MWGKDSNKGHNAPVL